MFLWTYLNKLFILTSLLAQVKRKWSSIWELGLDLWHWLEISLFPIPMWIWKPFCVIYLCLKRKFSNWFHWFVILLSALKVLDLVAILPGWSQFWKFWRKWPKKINKNSINIEILLLFEHINHKPENVKDYKMI